MSCLNRRDFLKLVGYSLLMTQMPYFPTVKKAQASLNPLDWVNLVNLSCINCDVDLTGCVSVDISWTGKVKVKIAPKIEYWIPEGFIETAIIRFGTQLQIGHTLPLGEILDLAITPFVSLIAPFLPHGSYGINSGFQNTYMKVYPHWFGFPKVVGDAVKTAMMALSTLDPVCLSCKFADSLANAIAPVSEIENAINEKISGITDQLSQFNTLKNKMEGFQEKYNQIMNSFSNVLNYIPFLPSELFFFMWMIQEFNPDTHTTAPLFNSIANLVTQASMPLSALVCPHLANFIGNHISFPAGIEPSFLCVGRWGFGYPRTGIVRHDDPIIASLLAIARFHHFFSKTIPLIPVEFSFDNVKYQMYTPEKTGCFKAGYHASDPIAGALFKAEESISDIREILQNPSQAISEIKDSVKQKIQELKESPLTKASAMLTGKSRSAGVVVWKKYSKCCW